ncbi:MAG: DUF4416 family protein [Candidatus Omnitrophota bacterium]|jgi:hypothetical protein
MGKISKVASVKLIIGFIYQDKPVFDKLKLPLQRIFGAFDFESAELDFNFTDYYTPEFGAGLKRKFVSFKKPIRPEELFKIKLYTNRLEQKSSSSGKRLINIDPGYLTLAKLVLASTKDYAHRIYLKKGIYAEVTLSYKGHSFQPLEWSYPDFRTQGYLDIFNQIRGLILPEK